MKGDIFNNSNGFIIGDNYVAATGDVFPAVGDIEPCELKLPFDEKRMELLSNTVQLRREQHKQAVANKEIALRDWEDCKRKLFCNAGPKHTRLNQREGEEDAAKAAYDSAYQNYNEAKAANRRAKNDYQICLDNYEKLKSEQALIEETQKKLNIEEKKVDIEEKKVDTVRLETTKDYAKYGLIGLGAIGVFVFGYLLIKK